MSMANDVHTIITTDIDIDDCSDKAIADDMHTNITTDIDQKAQHDKESATLPAGAGSTKVKGSHLFNTTYAYVTNRMKKKKKTVTTFLANSVKKSSTIETREDETNADAEQQTKTSSRIEAEAMETFLNNASTAVSSAVANIFSEAKSIADDMRTIVTTDIDDSSDEADSDSSLTARRSKVKGNHPFNTTYVAKPMKKRSDSFPASPMQENSAFETREDEINFHYIKSRMKAKANGSPATLAMLMTKLEVKKEQAKKLRQQLEQIKQEEVETRRSIWAQASGYSSSSSSLSKPIACDY
eukprot:scaffold5989_cov210-Skeletonema_menzelii.AAC.7